MLYETAITPELSLEERRHQFETEYSEFLTFFSMQQQAIDHDTALSMVVDRNALDPDGFNDEAELFQVFKSEYLEEFAPGSEAAQKFWEHTMATHSGTLHAAFLNWQDERLEEATEGVSMMSRLEIEDSFADDKVLKANLIRELKELRILRYCAGKPSAKRPIKRPRTERASQQLVDAEMRLDPQEFIGKAIVLAAFRAHHKEQDIADGLSLQEANEEWRARVQNTHLDLEREAAAWVKSGLYSDRAIIEPDQSPEPPSN